MSLFSQVLIATLRIAGFRAGPQDFPYAPQVTATLVTATMVAEYLLFSLVLPAPMALAWALAVVAGLALVSHSLLRARSLLNRFNQTFNTLLATSVLFTCLALPASLQLAPLARLVIDNPEIANRPETVQAPGGAVFIIYLLNFWNLAVSANIYRHSLNVGVGFGLLIALAASLVVLFLAVFFGSLAAGVMAIGK